MPARTTEAEQEAHDDQYVVSTEQNTNIVALGFPSGSTMPTSERWRTYGSEELEQLTAVVIANTGDCAVTILKYCGKLLEVVTTYTVGAV